jgi:hypothetical protein
MLTKTNVYPLQFRFSVPVIFKSERKTSLDDFRIQIAFNALFKVIKKYTRNSFVLTS